jgi:hypothetical protein
MPGVKPCTMYKVYPSLKEDINSPTVWLQGSNLDSRDLVLVKCKQSHKSVWVDAQIVDNNFLKNYNQPPRKSLNKDIKAIIISEWYRQKLGIKKGVHTNLEIKQIKLPLMRFFRQMQAALNHPDSAVRICAGIAIVSLLLGFIGLILGVISLKK